MRRIIHLSDIHFGRINYALVEPLIAFLNGAKADLIVISGDLTQRARRWQFREAAKFNAALPSPLLVVPGNHDVPLYNLANRFLRPFANYKHFISRNLHPTYLDGEIAVAAVNTARSLTFKNGRISRTQLRHIERVMSKATPDAVRIVVTHHPFAAPKGFTKAELIHNRHAAMERFAAIGVDVFLAGHLHMSHLGFTSDLYPHPDFNGLIVSAGTTTSTRGRGEPNSFNVLEIGKKRITVKRMCWNDGLESFEEALVQHYQKKEKVWAATDAESTIETVVQPTTTEVETERHPETDVKPEVLEATSKEEAGK